MKREYKTRGKSQKYKKLKEAYDMKFRKAAQDQLNKHIEDIINEHPGKAYSALKRMGAKPGDCENHGVFDVVSHQNKNLSLKQSTARIFRYFASISQEYQPLELERLTFTLHEKINQIINPN